MENLHKILVGIKHLGNPERYSFGHFSSRICVKVLPAAEESLAVRLL
jgi:hypothetical protein